MKASVGKPMRGSRRRILLALNVLLAIAAVAAVTALVLEYGFREPLPIPAGVLHLVQLGVVGVFIADRLLRLLIHPDRRGYFEENWTDFALILLAAALFAGLYLGGEKPLAGGEVLSAGTLYIAISQVYIVVTLLLRGVGVNLAFADRGVHPTWLLVGSFAALALTGSGLLMLPAAVNPDAYGSWYYDEALFTATSATCVTGLVVRNTGSHFTLFGQTVILVLIQLGGLGIMLFGTLFALLVGRTLSLRTSSAMREVLAAESVGTLGRVVSFVVGVTLAFEVVGAVLLYPMFLGAPDAHGNVLSPAGAAWHSLFHSVSSFCNAGFALYGNNMMQGVREGWSASPPLREHWQVHGVMAPMIVLGGLGFPVLQDVAARIRAMVRRARTALRRGVGYRRVRLAPQRLSLHSKLVLWTTGVLLVLGAGGLLVLERPTDTAARVGKIEIKGVELEQSATKLENLPPGKRLRAAAFQSVTARTAGFNTVDMDELSSAGKLWMCLLMVIGGSPASTAGGVKTVTIALLAVTAYGVIRRRGEVEVFRRRMAPDLLRKTVTLAVLYLLLVIAVTLSLSAAMRGERFIDVLFESCSACGTVGLSTGVTTRLGFFGRLLITAAMYLGRIGPVTLLFALTARMRPAEYSYATEGAIIG